MTSYFCLAQISDLHFAKPTLNPMQFFSKRWLGNLNLLFTRQNKFFQDRLPSLLDLFQTKGISHVAISGDLSTTSQAEEFAQATLALQPFKEAGLSLLSIPGNHDQYTRTVYKKQLFYDYFPSSFDPGSRENLKDHKVTVAKLAPSLWLVALDTALATSLFSSQGLFSPAIESELKSVLAKIPAKDKVILLNHFPFFQNDGRRKRLIRGNELRQVISSHPNIVLYLHGHSHRQTVADLRVNHLPIISDPGSTVEKAAGACHLFFFKKEGLDIEIYRFVENWTLSQRHHFAWNG